MLAHYFNNYNNESYKERMFSNERVVEYVLCNLQTYQY